MPELIEKNKGHRCLWGVTLNGEDPNHAPTKVILKKFLKSVGGNVEKAFRKLDYTIEWYWRYIEDYSRLTVVYPRRFNNLGFITCHKPVDAREHKVVVMWNMWNNVVDEREFYRDEQDKYVPAPLRDAPFPSPLPREYPYLPIPRD